MTLVLAVMLAAAGAGPPPVVHLVPAGMRHNDDFTVRVREPGGQWQDLYEHAVIVDLDSPQRASMVRFDMAGAVEVEIRRNNGDVRAVSVRPDRAGIAARLDGRVARFTLNRPAKLSVEFDGDRLHICTCSPVPWSATSRIVPTRA